MNLLCRAFSRTIATDFEPENSDLANITESVVIFRKNQFKVIMYKRFYHSIYIFILSFRCTIYRLNTSRRQLTLITSISLLLTKF